MVPLIDKLYARLREYRLQMHLQRCESRASLSRHARAVEETRAELVARQKELAQLRLDYATLLIEEVKQRRRAIAAMAVNAIWLSCYLKLRTRAASEAEMAELVRNWGEAATQGKKLDAIRQTDDDMIAPSVLTDHAGLLPGWLPSTYGTLTEAGRLNWQKAHEGRWMSLWKPKRFDAFFTEDEKRGPVRCAS